MQGVQISQLMAWTVDFTLAHQKTRGVLKGVLIW